MAEILDVIVMGTTTSVVIFMLNVLDSTKQCRVLVGLRKPIPGLVPSFHQHICILVHSIVLHGKHSKLHYILESKGAYYTRKVLYTNGLLLCPIA